MDKMYGDSAEEEVFVYILFRTDKSICTIDTHWSLNLQHRQLFEHNTSMNWWDGKCLAVMQLLTCDKP